MSDERYIRLLWWIKTGKALNLKNPIGFNEKLQWIKLFDRNPFYTDLVDKYKVRKFVEETVGQEYLIPLISVHDSPESINFESLPQKFVIKCNHNSGAGMLVCRDKALINFSKYKKLLSKELKKNYFYYCREWAYKNVKPMIVIESFLNNVDSRGVESPLIDYRFYCFNGKPLFLYVGMVDTSSGSKGQLKLSIYDLSFKKAVFYRKDHEEIPFDVKKPKNFEKMIEISKKLSANIPFVRVDLYNVDGHIFFSELTFYPGGGYSFFSPDEYESIIGNYLQIPITMDKK